MENISPFQKAQQKIAGYSAAVFKLGFRYNQARDFNEKNEIESEIAIKRAKIVELRAQIKGMEELCDWLEQNYGLDWVRDELKAKGKNP